MWQIDLKKSSRMSTTTYFRSLQATDNERGMRAVIGLRIIPADNHQSLTHQAGRRTMHSYHTQEATKSLLWRIDREKAKINMKRDTNWSGDQIKFMNVAHVLRRPRLYL